MTIHPLLTMIQQLLPDLYRRLGSLILAVTLVVGGFLMLPNFSAAQPGEQSNNLTLRIMEEELKVTSAQQLTVHLQQQAFLYKTKPLTRLLSILRIRPRHNAPGILTLLTRAGSLGVRAPPALA